MKLIKENYDYIAEVVHRQKTGEPEVEVRWNALFDPAPPFVFHGDLVAKQRPRTGHKGKFYTPKETRAFERDVTIAAKAYMNGAYPMPYPLRVDLMLFDRARVDGDLQLSVALVKHSRKDDIDNITKAVLDGCNKIIFQDDRQIVDMRVRRRYATAPGFVMRLWRAGMTDNEIITLLGVYRRQYGEITD